MRQLPLRSHSFSYETKRAFGGLLELIDHPDLRDVLIQVSQDTGKLWADFGQGLQRITGWQTSAQDVHELAVALIAAGGRHIDELNPCADVRLGDGVRVHAVLAPISVSGAAVSIRVPRVNMMSFEHMIDAGLCTSEISTQLMTAVHQRHNLLLTGGTGTGKTTLLAALLDLAGPDERIITIEDVAELRLRQNNWVALETRQANTEGAGELSLDRLLREALRMRPDRIVLGECRGAELLTLLTALNTGHNGGAGTLHASSVNDVPARLEALGALGGLTPDALARQVISALHLVVHLQRTSAGTHHITALGRCEMRDGALTVRQIA